MVGTVLEKAAGHGSWQLQLRLAVVAQRATAAAEGLEPY